MFRCPRNYPRVELPGCPARLVLMRNLSVALQPLEQLQARLKKLGLIVLGLALLFGWAWPYVTGQRSARLILEERPSRPPT